MMHRYRFCISQPKCFTTPDDHYDVEAKTPAEALKKVQAWIVEHKIAWTDVGLAVYAKVGDLLDLDTLAMASATRIGHKFMTDDPVTEFYTSRKFGLQLKDLDYESAEAFADRLIQQSRRVPADITTAKQNIVAMLQNLEHFGTYFHVPQLAPLLEGHQTDSIVALQQYELAAYLAYRQSSKYTSLDKNGIPITDTVVKSSDVLVEAKRTHVEETTVMETHVDEKNNFMDDLLIKPAPLQAFIDQLYTKWCLGQSRYIREDVVKADLKHKTVTFMKGKVYMDYRKPVHQDTSADDLEEEEDWYNGVDELTTDLQDILVIIRGEYVGEGGRELDRRVEEMDLEVKGLVSAYLLSTMKD